MRTIKEAYLTASSFLESQGVADARGNADVLLMHVLDVTRSQLLLRWNEPFPAEKDDAWQEALRRKAAGEPAQYIIGEQYFYGLPFKVTPAVLIPRPETELLVERVIELGQKLFTGDEEPVVCDVGAGSGAIAVSIAVTCPKWQVVSSDISAAALAVAAENAARNGAAVELVEGDLLAPHIASGRGIDILVSNPPYIPASDESTLQPEVRLYEPHTALFGGADGLDLYRRMAEQMRQLPALPKIVGFEVGIHQAGEVAAMLEQLAGWDEIEIVRDLAGIERHVVAYRRG